MSNTDFLGRAIDVVKKAIEHDTAGEYEKAYQLYYNACMGILMSDYTSSSFANHHLVELFMLALKCNVYYPAAITTEALLDDGRIQGNEMQDPKR